MSCVIAPARKLQMIAMMQPIIQLQGHRFHAKRNPMHGRNSGMPAEDYLIRAPVQLRLFGRGFEQHVTHGAARRAAKLEPPARPPLRAASASGATNALAIRPAATTVATGTASCDRRPSTGFSELHTVTWRTARTGREVAAELGQSAALLRLAAAARTLAHLLYS